MADTTVAALLASGVLDAELAALLWVLVEADMPLIVVAPVGGESSAAELRVSLTALAAPDHRAADGARPGGTVVGSSLEDVLRLGGASHDDSVPDTARELGIVLVLSAAGPVDSAPAARVAQAHYIRPIERDGAGHIQRRPPALLSAWNADIGALDHFFWAITDELATRAGLTNDEFEQRRRQRTRLLAGLISADARN